MIPFQWKAWWHYRRAAKGRHGTHAPFVYRFIEEALRPRSRESLYNRCAAFLKGEGLKPLLISGDAATMRASLDQVAHLLQSETVIMIADIHKDAERAAFWQECRADARVNRSLELWNLGLLFYKEDFKERQHFVLKAPA